MPTPSCFSDDASVCRLLEVLHGRGVAGCPSLLFTASHGLGWPRHPDQGLRQGAFIGQDWAGLGIVPQPSDCVAASDVADNARVHGLIAFFFACHAAGTPNYEQFPANVREAPRRISEQHSIAALPSAYSGIQMAGPWPLLATLSEHGLTQSNLPGSVPAFCLSATFSAALCGANLLATPCAIFRDRITAASVRLIELQSQAVDDETELITTWAERNDARNYIILGDPAARLRVDGIE